MTHPDSEAALEEATLDLFRELGWQVVNCFDERLQVPGISEVPGTLAPYIGRASRHEVILRPRLRAALERLNPSLPPTILDLAIAEIGRDRSMLSLARANQEIYILLKSGVKITYRTTDGEDRVEAVQVIDWHSPDNNDFFLAQQLWLTGEVYTRRPDLIGFVNGLPLLFVELKTSHRRLKDGYDGNLRDYRDTIPHLFWYNALTIISNGSDARLGAFNAEWRHYGRWQKINSEGETGIIALDTMIRATCSPERLLDLVENFVLFSDGQGKLHKIIAKNHQYLGVNQALTAVHNIRHNHGRLGVFWHTQGSGKSYSMVFFAQQILTWVQNYEDVEGHAKVVSLAEIAANDWNLNIPRYVEPIIDEETITVAEAFDNLQTALAEAYAAEDRLKQLLTTADLMPSGETV